MSYLIAAYALVIGTLAAYGWRVQSQRRQLMRQAGPDAAGAAGGARAAEERET